MSWIRAQKAKRHKNDEPIIIALSVLVKYGWVAVNGVNKQYHLNKQTIKFLIGLPNLDFSSFSPPSNLECFHWNSGTFCYLGLVSLNKSIFD